MGNGTDYVISPQNIT